MVQHQTSRLSLRQRRFIDAYLWDGNATQAAIQAGYSRAHSQQQGYQLLHHPQISARIAELESQRQEEQRSLGREVVRELRRIAFLDISPAFDAQGRCRPIRDLPEDLRHALASYEVVDPPSSAPTGGPAQALRFQRFRWQNKIPALALLGKNARLFTSLMELKLSSAAAGQLRAALPNVDPPPGGP
jgi:hypothetical protein